MPFKHQVLLKPRREAINEFTKVAEETKKLQSIPGVISFTAALNKPEHGKTNGYDWVMDAVLRSESDLKSYLSHSLHQQVLEKVKPLIEDTIVIDYTIQEGEVFQAPYPKDIVNPVFWNPGAIVEDKKNKDVNLFKPIKIGPLTLKNRIVVSPMCQYSSDDGFMNDWHLRHLGSFAVGGASLIIAEATGVVPEGRITPYCTGIYHQEHVGPLKRVVNFIHSFGALAGIQIGHAGRKASTLPPYSVDGGRGAVGPEQKGWPDRVVGPSPLAFDERHAKPKELTKSEMKELIKAFVVGTKRADEAGFDLIEIHGAHGYLISTFLSPLSNVRTDEYGGSLENRMRFPLEIVRAVRKVWPKEKGLWFRASVTDWVPGGFEVEDAMVLAEKLKEEGVDLLDCSTGGVDPRQSQSLKGKMGAFGYQTDLAAKIKKSVKGIAIGAVGSITSPVQAEEILKKDEADVILLARQIAREPYFAFRAARELGVHVGWNPQYGWGSKLAVGQDDRKLFSLPSKL